jgi:hypothetical protein
MAVLGNRRTTPATDPHFSLLSAAKNARLAQNSAGSPACASNQAAGLLILALTAIGSRLDEAVAGADGSGEIDALRLLISSISACLRSALANCGQPDGASAIGPLPEWPLVGLVAILAI